MSKSRDFAIGVDIGGTFTDLALLDRSTGRLMAGKVLTDYEDFAEGVLRGVERILTDNHVAAGDVQAIAHGTTLATNALVQRRGARTALIVTRGFRDILETGRGTRYDIFDLDIESPRPLVPRSRVLEITERVDFKGRVVAPLAESEVEELAARQVADRIEGVAVCLLHAYANPEHERRIGALLARAAPGLAISLSSDVVPAIGEYDRASTTAANVYLQPVVRGYLERLRNALKAFGIPRAPMVITSDGGTISCDTAVRYPVRLIESGPAGGAIAASYFGEKAGIDRLIGFDMGGTTAKICVIDDFEPERATEFEAARIERFARGSGLPLKVPAVEMIEIGAGGGSIAHVDATGLLKVGPESAGASPGPACYSFGGNAPTVTDADLCLGYLDPDYFLGGEMLLDVDRAWKAIERDIAGPLKLQPPRAAWGIHDVVNNNMARAAKIHCMEGGKDPRLYTLVAFGGAGPIHAYRIAQAIGIGRILYPSRAGIMSAIGFLVARSSFEFFRSYEAPLASGNVRQIGRLFADMERDGRALLKSAGVAMNAVEVRNELGVRYAGQAFPLYVRAPEGVSGAGYLAQVGKLFLAEYQTRYHRTNAGVPLEVFSLRALISGQRPEVTVRGPKANGAGKARKGNRPVYFPEAGDFVSCPVYDRYSLSGRIKGPAIIEERESTVVIGPGADINVDADNNLMVTLPSAQKPKRKAKK